MLFRSESLLFAVLGVALNLLAPTTWGRSLSKGTIFAVSLIAVLAIAAVAAAAGMAWAQVFLDPWPQSWLRRLEACGIFVGIVAQPIFALFFAIASKD